MEAEAVEDFTACGAGTSSQAHGQILGLCVMKCSWAPLQPRLGPLPGSGVRFKRALHDEGAADLPLLMPAGAQGADSQRNIQRCGEVSDLGHALK